MKKIDDVVLSDLLPSSIAEDRQVQNSATAIDPELKSVAGSLYVGAIYANVDKLTSTQLDHLAYCFDLTTWRDSWPLSQKRLIAKTVVAQKCRMGTLSAVKKVFESLGSAVSITEWWQKTPKGTPHTFDVIASVSQISGGLPGEAQEDFFRLLNEAKPVRSHYTFKLVQSLMGQVSVSGTLRSATFSSCSCEPPPLSESLSVTGLIRPVSYTHI